MGTITTLTSVSYVPSSPLVGSDESVIYRGANFLLSGLPPNVFYRAYAGSQNLNEPIPVGPLAGDLSWTAGDVFVTGSGTAFLDDLHIGQMMETDNGEVMVVAELISQTLFRNARPLIFDGSGDSGNRLPVLFELNTNRGAQLRGNAVIFDKGTILDVGDGTLYVNGAALAGDSLSAKRRLQVALYDSVSMTYDVQDVGFDAVPTIANTDISITTSGGVKNMSLGYYSFRVAYYSDSQDGFGNPTPTLLASGVGGYQIEGPNYTFNFDFSGDTPPPKATGYILYGSSFSNSSAQSIINSTQGGWFEFQRVPFTDLVSGIASGIEYTDNDLGALVGFDNDSPPDGEFITSLDLYPFLISTYGPGVNSSGREKTTSPGAFVSPIKPGNFDAYPVTEIVPTAKGETIIGAIGAAGRIFVMTANTLQAVTPTGLTSAPFVCRPFWKRGFSNPYNLIFVDDTLYGFTSAGVFRSIATGDEASESHTFAADVDAQMADWHSGYVYLAHDPQNELVAFCYSAVRQNDNGWWETDIFLYSLRQYKWVTKVTLTNPTRDMIVSGVATVANHFEFIAGGRTESDGFVCDTFRFDNYSGETVNGYLCFNYRDEGTPTIAKTVRKLRPTCKATNGKIQVYMAKSASDIDVKDLETGANPTYEYDLEDSDMVKQYEVQKCRVRNGLMWIARFETSSTWSGDVDDELDQFHQLAAELDISGQIR